MLRAQAITNQCYVVAAAQTGKHSEKRISYGHAMIVDPWGAVVAQCAEGNNVCFAEIDLDYLQTVREQLPCFDHKRHDLYSLPGPENNFRGNFLIYIEKCTICFHSIHLFFRFFSRS